MTIHGTTLSDFGLEKVGEYACKSKKSSDCNHVKAMDKNRLTGKKVACKMYVGWWVATCKTCSCINTATKRHELVKFDKFAKTPEDPSQACRDWFAKASNFFDEWATVAFRVPAVIAMSKKCGAGAGE